MSDNTGGGLKRPCQLRQGNVTILSNQFLENGLMGRKFAMSGWTT